MRAPVHVPYRTPRLVQDSARRAHAFVRDDAGRREAGGGFDDAVDRIAPVELGHDTRRGGATRAASFSMSSRGERTRCVVPSDQGRLEREGERVLVHYLELSRGERRTHQASTQPFEPLALTRLDSGCGVDRESAGGAA